MTLLKHGSWLKYRILPFGICCTLLSMTVFIVTNLMLSKSGSPVISPTGVVFNRTLLTLTCTSSGGPVDSATWRKDGEEISPEFIQTHTLTDTLSSTYEHTLSSEDVRDFVGSFTCEVRDADGNVDSRTRILNGVEITSSNNNFIVGSYVELSGSNDLGGVGHNGMSIQQASLTFDPVSDSLQRSEIICHVTRGDVRANKTLSISVMVPSDPITSTVNTTTVSTVAGSEFILNCIISSGPTDTPTAMWLNLGVPMTSGNGITITTSNTDDVAVAVLTFDPLRTSHDGTYRCTGRITSPASFDPVDVITDIDLDVQIPPPVVSLSVPPGPLVAGGEEDTLLTCSAMVNSTVVDVDVQDIRYIFTWQDRNGQDIVSGGHTIITPSSSSSSSSSLTLSPLSTIDTNFTCTVIVSEVQNKVIASEPGSATTTVDVVVPDDPVVTITSSGVSMAGNTLTLICYVTLRQALRTTPSIEWVWPNGTIRGVSNVTVSTTSESAMSGDGEVSTRTLSFTPVLTSHGGQYDCMASLNITGVPLTHSVERVNVTVQIPSPNVSTSLLQLPIRGTVVSLQGLAILAPEVDTRVSVLGVWTLQDSTENLTSSQTTSPPRGHNTTHTIASLSEGGVYVFTVVVTPSAPTSTFVEGITASAELEVTLQPYPALEIVRTVSSGECGGNEVATLTGTVSLLPNTASDYTLNYTWTTPGGQDITVSSEDLVVNGNTLQVGDLETNQGGYVLTACLSIPSSGVVGHCSSATYPISTAVPGQVTALECPASGDAAVLLIRWTQPSTNADSVYGYTVQVHQYMQYGRDLVPLPLDPPFYQQVETLDTSVESGVGMFLPYSVTVTPQNAAGCGFSISIDCFTQEGVPTMSPTNVGVIRSEEDPSEIVVTWQPLTLLEAKGFIEYLVQIHKVGSIKRQLLSMTVPMDEDSVTFSDLDTTADYEVSVGTITVSSGDTGPVSDLVSVPPVSDFVSVLSVAPALYASSVTTVLCIIIVIGTIILFCRRLNFHYEGVYAVRINMSPQRERTTFRVLGVNLKALEN